MTMTLRDLDRRGTAGGYLDTWVGTSLLFYPLQKRIIKIICMTKHMWMSSNLFEIPILTPLISFHLKLYGGEKLCIVTPPQIAARFIDDHYIYQYYTLS